MPNNPPVLSPARDAALNRQMQCWECRRRRLVCDGTQPVCTKCRAARIVCPGYADKKPLTWLAPGQVVSRTRKCKPARKVGDNNQDRHPPTTKVAKGLGESETGSQTDLSQTNALDSCGPFDLPTETYETFEALVYYNSCIYQDLLEHQLGPSAFIVPLAQVDQMPPSILHTLISTAISHRIIQMADDPGRNELVKPIWARLYRHRDHAIRAINVLVSSEQSRGGIVAIFSVYTFLFAMLQQSLEPRWRTHVDCLMSLINLRGSFIKLIRAIPSMHLGMIT
ncbi:Arginine metabolism regulation protein II, partial [Madurella mycetomatis]